MTSQTDTVIASESKISKPENKHKVTSNNRVKAINISETKSTVKKKSIATKNKIVRMHEIFYLRKKFSCCLWVNCKEISLQISHGKKHMRIQHTSHGFSHILACFISAKLLAALSGKTPTELSAKIAL